MSSKDLLYTNKFTYDEIEDINDIDKEIFKEQLASDDEDFDDVYEFMMDEQDPEECYKWEYSQIKGGYETDWHAGEDCITPRGEPL